MGQGAAVTIGFLTFALARLWHVFNMRDPGSGLFANEVVRNRWVWYAIGVCLVLTAAAAWLPGLSTVLRGRSAGLPSAGCWLLSGSLAPLLVGQVALSLWGLSGRREREVQ